MTEKTETEIAKSLNNYRIAKYKINNKPYIVFATVLLKEGIMATYKKIIKVILAIAENKVLNGIPVKPAWNRKSIGRSKPYPKWLCKYFIKAFKQLA